MGEGGGLNYTSADGMKLLHIFWKDPKTPEGLITDSNTNIYLFL